MPKFQKKFPKNALDYFDPASDEEFKQKHPVGYGVSVDGRVCANQGPVGAADKFTIKLKRGEDHGK